MSEKQIDPSLLEKARALGRAARAGGIVKGLENVANDKIVAPTQTPNAKLEANQTEGDNKQRSLPQEQAKQRGEQQQRPTGRSGR